MARSSAQVSALGKRKRNSKPYKRRVKTRNGSTKYAGKITGLSRQDFGFPERLKTKLHYCDVVQLAASAGNPGIYQFRMNSLFDPDYTGVGHQPQWFDQLSAVYNFYKVLGSKITVTFVPNQVGDIEINDKGPYIVGITTVSESASFSAATYGALLEDGNSVNGIIVDKQGGNNAKTLSNTYSPMRDLGLDPNSSELRVSTGGNPGYVFYANLWCLDMTEAASQDVVCKVEIEFMCEFDGRKENVNS